MKKIIAALDGLKLSKSTIDYTLHVARQVNAHPVGIFFEDPVYHSYPVTELITGEGAFSENNMHKQC